MKKYILFILIGLSLFSCRKKSFTESPDCKITLHMNHKVAGIPLEKGKINYFNSSGNKFSADILMYYIGFVKLTSSSGVEYTTAKYLLVDAFDSEHNDFEIIVPKDNYTKVEFVLGVEGPQNHIQVNDPYNDLNISYGMHWSWNFGYIFLKHEGSFVNNSSETKGLNVHYGTDIAPVYIILPMSLNATNSQATLNVNLDLGKVYSAHTAINFNDSPTGFTMHSAMGDVPYIEAIKRNLANSFSVE